jgi:hypothetical protein
MTAFREWIPGPIRTLGRATIDRLLRKVPSVRTSYDPYNVAARESLAERLFHDREKEYALGTIARGRFILSIIEEGFPTKHLTAEYFRNLELVLKNKERLKFAGQIALGVGPGRSGSTSLTALLATVSNSCCTHENPPLIFWAPAEAQVNFHVRRFELLSEYYSLVADVSHWWINALDRFFQHFPYIKVVGVVRDVDQCATSFMRVKGYGKGSWNHWAPYGNGIWAPHSWDPTYPTYLLPDDRSNLSRSKYDLIARYIQEYTFRLEAIAARLPNQVMLLRLDELSDLAAQARVFEFIGMCGRASKIKLNVRTVADGVAPDFKF